MRFWKQVLLLLLSTAEDIFPSSLSATGTRTHSCGTECLCVSMGALNHTVTEGPRSFKHWAMHQKFKSAIKKQTDLTIKRWNTALRSVRSSFSAFWKALLEEAVLSSSSSIHPLCGGGLISHTYLYIIFFMTYQRNRTPHCSEHFPNKSADIHNDKKKVLNASSALRDVCVCVCVRSTEGWQTAAALTVLM